ncbi:hypothetical protein AX15_003054 [Amanita polypyramis BW_CC]|nr:hypothetical protein AX15_003054 [Amanita polypyramis BW_CC]
MSTFKKQKAVQKKPPAGRPPSTTTISQPQVEGAANQSILSSFSPGGDLFCLLSLAVDKHRLRVYDTHTDQSIAEYIFESAKTTSLTWANLSVSKDLDNPPSANKRRRKNTNVEEVPPGNSSLVVILGLSNGAIIIFSPSHGRVIQRLAHPSSSTAILSVAARGGDAPTVWTSSADSAIRIWDIQNGSILSSWKNEERIPYTSIALRPISLNTGGHQILLAHHSIQLFSSDPRDFRTNKPKLLVSFTGHASQVKHLEWDVSRSTPKRFCSSAEGDRFLYIWQMPKEDETLGTMLASIPLESAVTTYMLLKPKSGFRGLTLVALTISGKVSFFHIPDEIPVTANSNRAEQKVPTIISRSQISISSIGGGPKGKIVSISPIPGQDGSIRVSRLVNGVRPVFNTVRYLDDAGDLIQNVVLEVVSNTTPGGSSQQTVYSKRYSENSRLAVGSGADIGLVERLEGGVSLEGDLDVNLAELSLGQRLNATSSDEKLPSESDRNDSDDGEKFTKSEQRTKGDVVVVPANSLTRTLIQALHSSDSRLLETCLAHSDPTLIGNTVRRLPPQLAVPLIIACTDRLGRGARSANMKGRGGGASSQRGTTLVVWIRTVLATHGGHLMTVSTTDLSLTNSPSEHMQVPDLVAKLAGIHATLTARLSLQGSLLSLSGRLELVLYQMQIRSSAAPALLVSRSEKVSNDRGMEVTKYVEGESEESDDENENENELMDIEGNIDDDGSIEDVELGANSEGDESDEADEEMEDDDAPTVNGLIDDESEEYSQDDDNSNSE